MLPRASLALTQSWQTAPLQRTTWWCHLRMLERWLGRVSSSQPLVVFDLWPHFFGIKIVLKLGGHLLAPESGSVQCRHINNMTMEAWYAEYLLWCDQAGVGPDDQASNRTFRDVYQNKWKSTLVMRELSQHARPGTGQSLPDHKELYLI